MNKNKITYVFLSGRKKRLEIENHGAREFFYGFHHFQDILYSTVEDKIKINKLDIIEFNKSIDSPLDKILRKMTDLPFFSSKVMTKDNFKTFLNTTSLFLTNQRVGFSMIFINLPLKIIKKTKINIFIMGLFNKRTNYKIKSIFRSMFIGLFVLSSTKLIFLSEGEFEYAVKKMPFWSKRFIFLPFAVDTDFWKFKKKEQITNKVLFIGNDGQRDYSFIIELAEALPKYKFTIVSGQILRDDLKSANIELINGSWDNDNYSDDFIHDLYTEASVTIIPIKNSLQPSGQSVALQSMSSGTPVIITKTDGFWEPEVFRDSENIFFANKNSVTEWEEKINNVMDDSKLLNYVAKNARDTVVENNNLETFNRKLEELI